MLKNQNNRTGKIGLAIAAGLLIAFGSQTAEAQRPSQYYPARQTFSPYLLYNQVNTTGIPNYYTYVQPATQFRDFVNRIPANPRATGDTRETLVNERAVARILDQQLRERTTTGIGAPAAPAAFGNYSHFYAPRAQRSRR